MGHMADCADVDGGLPGNDLGAERGQLGHVQVVEVLNLQLRLRRRLVLGHGRRWNAVRVPGRAENPVEIRMTKSVTTVYVRVSAATKVPLLVRESTRAVEKAGKVRQRFFNATFAGSPQRGCATK